MERKTKTLMISAMLVLAILSGIAVMAYANGLATNTSNETSDAYGYWGYYNGSCGFPGGRGHGWGRGGFMPVTVSQEYEDNVINIMQNDTDVQHLLADGYNITDVRPVISATVEGDGTVTMKATTAMVMMSKDTTGRAMVWVDLEQAKVTRIEILTRTVIEKP